MTRQTTLDIFDIVNPDHEASFISNKWDEWRQGRSMADVLWKEVRDYVFATDTRTTSNSSLPWKNTTTTPKLTQIRDNLQANYLSSLFPKRNWIAWEATGASGVRS